MKMKEEKYRNGTKTVQNEPTKTLIVQEVNKMEEDDKSDMENVEDFPKTYNKDRSTEIQFDTSKHFIRDEDLQDLLLYYMKLTFDLRKKNADEVGRNSDENSGDSKGGEYSASTDSDTEEDAGPRKIVPKITSYKCKHCLKVLRGAHSLKNHCMRKHGNNEEKNVLCDKCPTRFYTEFEFNRHYQTHNSIKNFLCHLCSKKFVQKSTLDLHLRYHKNDRRYQCEVCRKKFFTNNHLKRHFLTHTNQRDFKCEPCDRSFRYKDHLRRHLQSVHIGIRTHSCPECHKSFMYLSQLKFHEQCHSGIPYRCKNCKQTFRKRTSLKVHQRQCKG